MKSKQAVATTSTQEQYYNSDDMRSKGQASQSTFTATKNDCENDDSNKSPQNGRSSPSNLPTQSQQQPVNAPSGSVCRDVRIAVRTHFECDVGLTPKEAADAEIGIFNWSLRTAESRSIPKMWTHPGFVAIYESKAKSVLVNLDPRSFIGNPSLILKLRNREFAPHDVAFLSPLQTYPEKWRSVIEAKAQKEDFVYNEKPTAMTNQYKCGNCKQRECVYRELQLRSCDEPVTLFITCVKCGNSWRMG